MWSTARAAARWICKHPSPASNEKPDAPRGVRFFQTVEKVAKLLFRMGLREISTSISCEIVGQNFVRGVISEAHVLENDEIRSYFVVCGRRNSLQEGFFDKLEKPLLK